MQDDHDSACSKQEESIDLEDEMSEIDSDLDAFIHVDGKNKSSICDTCGMTFTDQGLLRRHIIQVKTIWWIH